MKVVKFPDDDQNASLLTSSDPRQQFLAAGDHAVSKRVDNDDIMAFPPPPPAQLLNQHDVTGADSDDEFPLPPPPDQEITAPQTRHAAWPGEAASRHAGLMHSASVKPVQVRPGPPVAAKHYRMTVAEPQQSVSHAATAHVNKSASTDTDFLSQIQRGISLRRTVSNDRSAPRIPDKR